MAKPGAGKREMQRVRKKQWNNTTRSLKRTAKALGIGKKRKKETSLFKILFSK